MRRIAVFSTAGGSGKTTTVMNLAVALAERGRRVLAVDLDPGARLLRAFGQVGRADLLDCISANLPLARFVSPTKHRGVFLLGATLDLTSEERLRRAGNAAEARVVDAVATLCRGDFDFVLFDCGSTIQRFVTMALGMADEHLAPIEPAPLSIASLNEALSFGDAVRSTHNSGLARTRILITRSNEGAIARRAIEQLVDRFGRQVLPPPIPHSDRVIEASECCEPIVSYAADDAAAVAYRRIANGLVRLAPRAPSEGRAAHV